jgi:hypothetical protein
MNYVKKGLVPKHMGKLQRLSGKSLFNIKSILKP